jgi:OOP family OmpA-OmpF porin
LGAVSAKALIFLVIVAAGASAVSWLVATRAVDTLERTTILDVQTSLRAAGQEWVEVRADGLIVRLSGNAPSESSRFQALEVTGQIVDTARIDDTTDVVSLHTDQIPEFSLKILRNAANISLIGLMPDREGRLDILKTIAPLHAEGTLTDLLEALEYEPPEGWRPALAFALDYIDDIERGAVLIEPGRIEIEAFLNDPSDMEDFEASLREDAPQGTDLTISLSAPKAVKSPFLFSAQISGADTLQITACDLNTPVALETLSERFGETMKNVECDIALGAPSPRWIDAIVQSITAIQRVGSGSLSIADADIEIIGPQDADQTSFDAQMETLRSALPELFSLTARLPPSTNLSAPTNDGEITFTATLDPDDGVSITGALRNETARDAVQNYAAALFGNSKISAALEVSDDVQLGWTQRVLASLEALSHLYQGKADLRGEQIALEGITIEENALAQSTTALAVSFLPENIQANVEYDEELKAFEAAPDARMCEKQLGDIMRDNQVVFAPNSADISGESELLLDKIASIINSCIRARFEVGGHTDSQGREIMNKELSQSRAEAVRNALLERQVLGDMIDARGYGEAEPIAPNETEEGRAKNRRIAFKLIDDGNGPVDGETGDDESGEDDTNTSEQDTKPEAEEQGSDNEQN